MDRRESLKAIGLGALSTGLLLGSACQPNTGKAVGDSGMKLNVGGAELGREAFEVERDRKLNAEKFFTAHEMATITLLGDMIIPKDEHSGSASDAKVPDFIEFIVKDIPSHQIPMRGGLRWLDLQCLRRYDNLFIHISDSQRIEIITEIAYPNKAKSDMQQGVSFFNRMRNLTASGFFTSKMGIEDLGYAGNIPGKWEGVPADVLEQYDFENLRNKNVMNYEL